MKTLYEFECAIEEIMDDALNELSTDEFERFKDFVSMIPDDYEGDEND